MAGVYIHIDSSKREAFMEELLLHDCVYSSDIEERGDNILVLANIAHDFTGFDIDGRRSGAIKVIFDAEYYMDQPVTV